MLIAILSMVVATGTALAQEGGGAATMAGHGPMAPPKIYTIYGISIDETAATASRARQIALKKVQRIALKDLFRKILRKQDYDELPPVSDSQVRNLVSGLEIADEKSSYVRYLADFTVHFSRDKINNFLSARKIPFAETLSRPVTILAVLEKDGATILWGKNNDWRRAWKNYDTANNLVPIRVVDPSLANRMALTFWQVQTDRNMVQKFADVRKIHTLYVINARVENNPALGRKTLELTIFSNDKDIFTTIIDAGHPEDLSVLYDAAIKRATYWLDNKWKEKVLVHFGQSSDLKVKIHFDRSQDWFIIRRKLNSISLIHTIIYHEITTTMIEVDLKYSGDIEQIILALGQQNLMMTKSPESAIISADYVPILTLKK